MDSDNTGEPTIELWDMVDWDLDFESFEWLLHLAFVHNQHLPNSEMWRFWPDWPADMIGDVPEESHEDWLSTLKAIHFDENQKASHNLGYTRPTNRAGGLEAGMTNGQPLILRAAMKPISTLQKPLDSIDMESKEPSRASYERSDICAVPAASVILEAVVALEIATAMIDKFGGDSVKEMLLGWQAFQEIARSH